MEVGARGLTPLVLKGGASVTVWTSEVERDVRELSGTLDTGGASGVVLGLLTDDRDGDEPADALVVEDIADVAGVELSGGEVAAAVDDTVLLGAEADVAGDDTGEALVTEDDNDEADASLVTDDTDDSSDAELPGVEADVAGDEAAVVGAEDDGDEADSDVAGDETGVSFKVEVADDDADVALSGIEVDTSVGDEAGVDEDAGEKTVVDVVVVGPRTMGDGTSGQP